ncbi:MAG TPA: substrate-binding domain-containing protein [Chloroflexota bacterium]|nr:substrate-binding domain-containing protein [Chloroflexota bacterium]
MERRSFINSAALAGAGAAAAASGLGLTGLTEVAQAMGKNLGSLRFECIVKTINSPYWTIVLAAAKKAAKDLGVQGLSYTGGPSEADINAEVNLLENAIAKKVDFIVCAPTDKTALNATIDKAYNSGIKVILIDSAATTKNYHAFLSTDNVAGGMACADALAASIKAKTGSISGQIAYATFQSNVGSLGARDQGFLQGIKKYPGLKIVAHKDAGGDPSYVKEASIAADTITAFPNLVGYWGDNLQCVEGAATAFKEKGVSQKKVSLGGFDSDATLISELKSGRVDFLLLQNPYMMGYGGVCYGILAALGVQVPVFLNTGDTVATTANVNSPMIQGLLDPLGKPGEHLGF